MEIFKDVVYSEIILGGFVGAVLGFGLSEVKGYLVQNRDRRRVKQLYQQMCSKYRRQIKENEFVESVITYLHDNILKIDTRTFRHEEMQEYWSGEIKMDTTNQGLIVWHHEFPPALDRNGFKRIIVSPV